MTMPSAPAAAQNWARGMSNATQKIAAGIDAVTVSPTSQAAAAVDRMVAGIQRAAASGKIAAGLNAVSLADWKQATKEKGIPRIASGAQAAVPRMQSFLTKFLPHLASGVQQLNSQIPRGDLENNINRATFMMRWNSNFKNSG